MKLVPAVLAGMAVLSLAAASPAADSNLLIITIDTLRTDRLSCYRRDLVRTPAIDALAARGVLFERAFAHCPTTLPSHTNIMTGMTPPSHGVHENSKSKVPGGSLTIAEYLKTQGYATAAFVGAFPLNSRFGLGQGFDVYDDRLPYKPANLGTFSERKAQDVVAAAMAWFSGQKGKWFCWIHLWDPHAPYAPPEPFLTEYRDDPYSGEAAFVDAQLSVLFGMLQDSQLAERTLVVLTADHGESLGEHGEMTHSYFAYNSTIHVPLIIAGPGVRPLRVTGTVGHIDIFPTACELLGIAPPKTLQGRSLVAPMKGRPLDERPVYFESLEPYLNERCAPLRGFIDRRTKYMDSPVPEVYDMARDFQETENLAGKSDLGPLKKKLDRLMKSLSSSIAPEEPKVVDRQALERLRSLGYVTSPITQVKSSYGVEDDLKSFLPYQQKLEQAILLLDKGGLEESARKMTALTKEKTTFVPAFIYLSQVLQDQGRYAESVQTLEDGLRANPGDYALISGLGTALVRTRQWDRAVEILQKALGVIDYDPDVWSNLGISYMMKQEYPQALESLEKAISLDPGFVLAVANVGAVRQAMYFNRGRQPEDLSLSLDYFRRALAVDPTFDLAWRGLGVSCWTAGRDDEAIAAWEKAVALSPGDDFSIYHLGILYLNRGDKSRALQNFEKYVEIKGDKISREEKGRLDALIELCKR